MKFPNCNNVICGTFGVIFAAAGRAGADSRAGRRAGAAAAALAA